MNVKRWHSGDQRERWVGSGLLVAGDQDSEVKFGNTGHTDGQLARDRDDVVGDEDARVQNPSAHRADQGSSMD